jgi:hypothetical protein
MAVLVEGISVITRRDSIDAKCRGGWNGFLDEVPNATLCFDEEIARVGFMAPPDVEEFVARLEARGLVFLADGEARDIAVVDQQHGLTSECDWLEFARLSVGEAGNKVAACWFFDGPRVAAGIHLRGKSMNLATPPGWTYEESLSRRFSFVATERLNERLEFLRSEGGMDVFLDRETGKEVFVGRGR